jgi:hypothetical protein
MLDAQHDHLAPLLVDAIEDAVGTAAGRMDAGQLPPQRLANPARLTHERRREELDHGSRNSLRQALGECAGRGRCDD